MRNPIGQYCMYFFQNDTYFFLANTKISKLHQPVENNNISSIT